MHVLTYQSLCQADDPGDLLRGVAERRWAHERAQATGQDPTAVLADTRSWTGTAAVRREQELNRIVARLKRRAASGGLSELSADGLLSRGARRRLDELMAAGIPTPAVAREGHLAPYQELVQLCEPLVSERDWLAARHERFTRLLLDLDDPPEELSLSVWLLARLRERRGTDGSQMSWAHLARRQPRLAAAGLRWLHQVGEPTPEGAPRGEAQRAPLDIDDWVALLSDYVLGCLRASAEPGAADRVARLRTALGELGYTVTRQGIRHTGTEVDQVLVNSAAKPLAACDILATEFDSRGTGLRAVVLCDSQHGPRQSADSPLALSGGGRGLLAAVGADDRLAAFRPSAEFSSRRWTDWATRLLATGESRLLVGTRGLLGEGWTARRSTSSST